jgi:hypothetical protein
MKKERILVVFIFNMKKSNSIFLFSMLLSVQILFAQPDRSFAPAESNISGAAFPKISNDLRVWLQIKEK